ncbi:unnamed protein product, partial [Discosporangium mesarthrocarpum]
PPVPVNEQARLAELYRFEILDTLREESFDRLTEIVALTFDVPIALVTFVDRHRHWFKSEVGFPISEIPRENGFCGHTIMNDDVMVIPDASQDVRFADDPAVSGPSKIRFYAGAPLTLSSGFRVGTLCMMDTRARPEGLASREREILIHLAALAVREIELRQATADETSDLSDELKNAQSAKQQFLQMLSHELRTPLNAVIGFSAMIADAGPDEVSTKYKSYAGDIAKAGDHLLDLVEGMLDWTRLERGELNLEDSVTPVCGLIDKAVALLPKAAGRVKITPVSDLPQLRCDPRYVVQVLAHVIDNAIRFSPESETVSIEPGFSADRNLVIRVTDNGPGLNDEVRTRAFDVFEKFGPSGKKLADGIGLGLAISRKLMEVHGGSIDFSDGRQSGSTVVLAFPAHRTVA